MRQTRHDRRAKWAAAFAAAVVCVAGWCSRVEAAVPLFMGLGDLPGGDFRSEAYGVSADGSVVVGSSRSAASAAPCDVCNDVYPEAFRWTAAGGMMGLGDLPGGAFFSEAAGVSADGAVVVGHGRTDPFSHGEAFRWTAAEGLLGLGSLTEGGLSQASGVSADGSVVVGSSRPMGDRPIDFGAPQAFRWTATGGMVGLGFLPGEGARQSIAYGVSADGSVVVGRGFSESSGFEAFRWTVGDGMVSLGVLPGGTSSEAYAVSADGSVVVGGSFSALGRYEPFRWTAADGMVSLGVLPGTDIGESSYAKGVSADGSVIVGVSNSEAFIWDATHGMRSLRDVLINNFGLDLSGWTLFEPNAISADGQTIVGNGLTALGVQGWIAVVPEPTSAAFMVCATVTLCARWRYQRQRRSCGCTSRT